MENHGVGGGFHGYHQVVNNNNVNECTVREQDRFMPIANVIRIMRKILPPHAKISDDAKETIQECVSEYISFITGEANERCQREQRKTITAEDVLWAMSKLGFDDYVDPLTLYLHRYRELEGDRGTSSTATTANIIRTNSATGGDPYPGCTFLMKGGRGMGEHSFAAPLPPPSTVIGMGPPPPPMFHMAAHQHHAMAGYFGTAHPAAAHGYFKETAAPNIHHHHQLGGFEHFENGSGGRHNHNK